jgi:acyl-CoA reductase-like NAD-dependent aldehyde dehydrogenase
MHVLRETFGPFALTPLTVAKNLSLANDTEYGLASCVYTQDLEKNRRFASRIQAGQSWNQLLCD